MESEPSKKRRMQTFKMEYSAEWPVLKPSKVGQNHAFCSVCKLDISISHGGCDDCRRHMPSCRKLLGLIHFFNPPHRFQLIMKSLRPRHCSHIFSWNITFLCQPLTMQGNCSRVDSKIAKSYSCARTKSTAITGEMSKQMQEKVSTEMDKPFSLSTDGSTDKAKLYPVVVRHWNDEEMIIKCFSLISTNVQQ